MAWVSKGDRWSAGVSKTNQPSENVGPGTYIQHSSHEVEATYAPFGSTKPKASASKDCAHAEFSSKGVSPPPGAYDPKLPKDYDSGLPKKHVPFNCGAGRDEGPGSRETRPGPGTYHSIKVEPSMSCRTMGAPQGISQSVFRSSSAPSIPREHQCYGYEEGGDGRLLRQGPKSIILTGRAEQSAGPGQYDEKRSHVAPRVLGGKMATGPAREPDRFGDAPGPGHYIAKNPVEKPVYSSFASQSIRGMNLKGKEREPGPGQYSSLSRSQPSLREMHAELQYFNSTTERFKDDRGSSEPGPGAYYGPKRQGPSKSSWGKQNRLQDQNRAMGSCPGPGQYEPMVHSQTSGPTGTVSILGSTGSLAFGSMESRKGMGKDGDGPGPGAYAPATDFEDPQPPKSDKRPGLLRRPAKAPHSVFKSSTPKDECVRALVRTGQQLPPPGAYSPIHPGDIAAVMRQPPKGEGFLSGATRGDREPTQPAPGPGRYDRMEITGGKRGQIGGPFSVGTFNRTSVEGAPSGGRPKGLGFESSEKNRFKMKVPGKQGPGPGAYDLDLGWVTKTHNIHFGDVG